MYQQELSGCRGGLGQLFLTYNSAEVAEIGPPSRDFLLRLHMVQLSLYASPRILVFDFTLRKVNVTLGFGRIL